MAISLSTSLYINSAAVGDYEPYSCAEGFVVPADLQTAVAINGDFEGRKMMNLLTALICRKHFFSSFWGCPPRRWVMILRDGSGTLHYKMQFASLVWTSRMSAVLVKL